jgi:dTDP-4-amino-4,6-dideoxygalactose transaminase
MRKIRFFHLAIDQKEYREKLKKKFERFLIKGNFFLGPEVSALESRIAKFNDSKYAIGVSSGSSALYLCLKAAGIKSGDEVITTPLSWIVTANAIVECGAKPVFVDVNYDMNINPNLIQEKITKRTKAILPMHYAGLMCDMNKICKIADDNKIKVIEDSAQAFGASINNIKSGNFSYCAAFSMNPMKPLSGFGENGFIVTNSSKVYNSILELRYAGVKFDKKKIKTNNCFVSSLNHKIDNLNATFLIESLNRFKKKKFLLEKIAKLYDSFLPFHVKRQEVPENYVHGRYVYPVLVRKRDKLKIYLEDHGIETKIFNYPLIPKAPAYKAYARQHFKVAEEIVQKNLVLPAHDKLSEDDIFYIADKIKKFYSEN